MDFVGAKAALFHDGRVLVLQRDDRPGLPWPGLWDLPGGGREGGEDAAACLLREVHEEVGLTLAPHRLAWKRVFPSMLDPTRDSVFFAGRLQAAEVAAIRLGGEGQAWAMMPVEGFLVHPQAVPEMQRRAGLAWGALGGGT